MNEVAVKKANLPSEIKGALKSDFVADRMLKCFGEDSKKIQRFQSALIEIANDKNLALCNVNSVLKSAFSLAELDLDLSKNLGLAYVLKYKQDAQPVISYKGWLTLAARADIRVKAYSVFDCDEFSRDLSSFDEKIHFVPNDNERKSSDDKWYLEHLKGVLVKLKETQSGFEKVIFVPADKLEKIRKLSPSGSSSYSPHNSWAEEMNHAKAIKYVLSKEPMSEKKHIIARAVAAENEFIDLKNSVLENSAYTQKLDLNEIVESEVIENDGQAS